MKITSLNCFNGFKCIVGKCNHNCCIGWDIDIDKKSLKKYKKIKGEDGEKVKQSVDFENSCFIKKDNRCAFLNSENLCELIIRRGESSLCQVCRDHPRYRNYFSDHIEMGYGICCEVARDLVIEYDGVIKEEVIKKGFSLKRKSKFEKEIIKYKQKIFEILERDERFYEKLIEILNYIGVKRENIFLFNYKEFLMQMEILNKEYENALLFLDEKIDIKEEYNHSKSLENLLYYFIHRNVSGAIDFLDIKSRIVFSLISVLIIENISKNQAKTEDDFLKKLKDNAREYSAEIEYSENNVNRFLDKTDEFIK